MSYPGGKGGEGVAQRIINQAPPHLVYIEPCLGGGSVMKALRPALLRIGCDLSAEVLDAFSGVGRGRRQNERRRPHEGKGKRDKGKSSRTVHSPLTPDPFLLHRCGVDFVAECFGLMDHDFILNGLPGDWFRFEGFRVRAARVLIYWDPPYPHLTRTKKRIYEHEWSDEDHARFLSLVTRLPCLQMISTYPNPQYDLALKGWRKLSYLVQTRGGMRRELLYCNFSEPQTLHDYRHLGGERRERQKISRRRNRWCAGLARMPRKERLAVLAEIADRFRDELCFDSAERLSLTLGGAAFPPAATLQLASRYPTPEMESAAGDDA